MKITDKTQEYKTSRTLIVFALITCVSLLVCAGCRRDTKATNAKKAFEIDKDYKHGPLTVHVRVDKAKVTIAETVLLELEAGIEPGFEVKMPKVDKVIENFGIIDWNNLGNKLDENNNVVSTYRYRLEPFLSGTFSIPAFTFEFYDVNRPEDNKYELTTEPIDIEVASLLGAQRAELKIANIEGVVSMPEKPSYWWIWVLCAIAVIAGVIVAVIFACCAGVTSWAAFCKEAQPATQINEIKKIGTNRLFILLVLSVRQL